MTVSLGEFKWLLLWLCLFSFVNRTVKFIFRHPHALHLPLVCRKTLTTQTFPKFQRINLIREVRKYRNKAKQPSKTKIIINSLVLRQSQGPFVPPQGL